MHLQFLVPAIEVAHPIGMQARDVLDQELDLEHAGLHSLEFGQQQMAIMANHAARLQCLRQYRVFGKI